MHIPIDVFNKESNSKYILVKPQVIGSNPILYKVAQLV